MTTYLFNSERLGFRNWRPEDSGPFAELCADEEVMKYFPKTLTKQESDGLIDRMIAHYKDHGFTYFAVDRLDTSEFIGFIGLAHQTWESEFTPCVDLGYRLHRAAWGNGFATEGASACLKMGFEEHQLPEIYAFAPDLNVPSQSIMKKIGMSYAGTLQHPKIESDSRFRHCVAYKMTQEQHREFRE